MTRTYVDSGVLIAAAKGSEELSEIAMRILEDESRDFIGSVLLRMETSALATFHGYALQSQFYETFLNSATTWVSITDDLIQNALDECRTFGLQAFDALHIAAAAAADADEFITAERATSRIHSTTSVKVVGIRPLKTATAENP